MSVLQNIPGAQITERSSPSTLTAVWLSWFTGLYNYLTVAPLKFDTSGNLALPGTLSVTKALGVNGVTPPAQVTGWGTPVGNAVIASYNITDAGGANSNTNKALAQIISDLKALGFYGA